MSAHATLPKRILVFGATGLIGQYIIQEIYNAQSSFEKIGFFTSESTAKNKAKEVDDWKAKGVEVIVGDVNSEHDVAKAYEDYDTVISALGRDAILAQIPLLKLAKPSSSIKFFYPSEYGTDIEYDSSSALEKPHQLKLQVRNYVRENADHLKVTYLVTGPYSDLFFGPSPEPSVGSFDAKRKKATLVGTGEEEISFTTEKDVGRLLVAALQTPASDNERILKVNSFTVRLKDVVAEFEKQTGAQWEVSYTPIEDVKKAEVAAWEKNSPFKTLYTLRRIWAEGKTLYEENDNGKVGFGAPETLEEQVKKAVHKQG